MKIRPTKEQKEMRALHEAYDKHEPRPLFSVWMDEGEKRYVTQVCVCPCGACIAGTTAVLVGDMKQPEIMPHLLNKAINEGWQDQIVKAISHNGLAQDADAMGKNLQGDSLRYVDRAIKAMDLFIEKHRGR